MQLALLSHRETETNLRLVEAAPAGVEAKIVPPSAARSLLGPGDAALARLDVLPTLDGIEPGTLEVGRLEADGVPVLNPLAALLAVHDKLGTARLLENASLPHPRTEHVVAPEDPVSLDPPFVIKPRFGSWGRDVVLCSGRTGLSDCLKALSARQWFRKGGALVQELVPPLGYDLRLVVAGGQVVGAIRRRAAEGEWRTNVALGATRETTTPPQAAVEVGLAAAAASGADLVGVDLLPKDDGSWTVIELNGAVEFTDEYSFAGDVFGAALGALVATLAASDETAVAASG
jgi:[lysine-biosynthesis-protein LysW]--L-2-aminoadipate ligase